MKQFLFLYMNFPNSLQSITGSLRMLSAFYLVSALLNEEKGGEGGEGQKGGCVGAANAEITRCKILHLHFWQRSKFGKGWLLCETE